MTFMNTISSSAFLSPCNTYRYRLGRSWGPGPADVWIMLNPSTADATLDDPTIRRCIGFSRSWGSGSLVVVNLFALRATDPAELAHHPDPVGLDNDEHIAFAAAGAREHGGRIFAAWGAHPMAAERAHAVARLVDPTALLCLGTTKAGAPRHPLYVKGDTTPTPWRK
jgi:hypothetical protein